MQTANLKFEFLKFMILEILNFHPWYQHHYAGTVDIFVGHVGFVELLSLVISHFIIQYIICIIHRLM